MNKRLFVFLLILIMNPVVYAQQSGNAGVDIEFDAEPVIQDPQFSQQEKSLLEAIQNQPNDVSLSLKLAQLYQQHRYYEKAISLLESAVQLDPDNAYAHYLLGQIMGSQKRDPNRAIDEMKTAIQLAPDSIRYRQEMVSIYYRLQRFPPALEQLEEILKREPANADALYRKAVILHIRGEVEEAESIVDRLPKHEHARVLKALLVQQRGEDAEPLYEAILKDHPNNIRAQYEYGKYLFRVRKFEEAQKIFETIIDTDPFYQHALFQLIKIYAFKKQKEKVTLAKQSLDRINRMGRNQRNFYRSYLRHHPDTAETHFSMALIYLEIGRGNLAADELRHVLVLDPDNKEAPFYLAQINMASHQYENAIQNLNQCLPIREDKAALHAMIAQCCLELHDAKKALQHLETALKIDPENPLANRIRALWANRISNGKSN